MKLIDKAAVVAEIEKYITNYKRMSVGIEKKGADWVDSVSMLNAKIDTLHSVLSFIDTLEVKEVNWRKITEQNLWKPTDGDELPELDREVIVLYQRYPLEDCEYSVGFGHRPKEYWDGKNIETGEITRYYPKRYDKGGWNIPDAKYWLDYELPTKENNPYKD